MDEKLVAEIRSRLDEKSTEELANIYKDHNEDQWSGAAFEAVRQILETRGAPIPVPKEAPTVCRCEHAIQMMANSEKIGHRPRLVATSCPDCKKFKWAFFEIAETLGEPSESGEVPAKQWVGAVASMKDVLAGAAKSGVELSGVAVAICKDPNELLKIDGMTGDDLIFDEMTGSEFLKETEHGIATQSDLPVSTSTPLRIGDWRLALGTISILAWMVVSSDAVLGSPWYVRYTVLFALIVFAGWEPVIERFLRKRKQ